MSLLNKYAFGMILMTQIIILPIYRSLAELKLRWSKNFTNKSVFLKLRLNLSKLQATLKKKHFRKLVLMKYYLTASEK